MRHKYQVFVSSTFQDLRDAREAVSWELLKLGHIPVGMENFSAADGRGWETITQTIDGSDYYLLVVGGRYGSIDPEFGISWTEREYDYAHAHGLPVLAFIRDKSGTTLDKADVGSAAKKLRAFIKKIESRHHRETWKEVADLTTKVNAAVVKAVQFDEERKPRPGWYRGTGSGRGFVRETRMRYYHVHLRAAGRTDECLQGKCLLTYYGSGLVESPQAPARFEDRVKASQPIISCRMNPSATILNSEEFRRNPTQLHYAVEAPGSSELHITGEVVATTGFRPEMGGFGLHVPHPADWVTFVVDMLAVELEPTRPLAARLVVKDEKGVAVRRKDLVEMNALVDKKVWMVSAREVPVDSNIEVSWGDDS
jgi:hypothetical protein